jgi:hypothetical protein
VQILFSVRNPSYIRHYESVLRLLIARGHRVRLAVERSKKEVWPAWVYALAEEYPQLEIASMPPLEENRWFELSTRLRQARFYLRFLEPKYRGMSALLARARSRAPRPVIYLGESIGIGRVGRRLLARVLDVLDRSTRTPEQFYPFLTQQRPDIVVLTPLVVLRTSQLDLARAAIELGIRNVFAVASWDNLSSKGELTFSPQRVFVWNEVQRQEVNELHGIDTSRVTVTGAQVFDEWFEKRPSTTREEFCARVGLRPDQPIVLYVCSALLEGSPPEPSFVERWARHLRASHHPALTQCGILIRPHFKRGEEWRAVQFTGLENIVCWPPVGAVPADASSKTDYFDSLFHASAVVGLNTSAMIEAAILGRPVLTVLLPEFRDSQEGTVHFHYLLHGPDALLRTTRSLDDHARELADALDARDADVARSGRFIRTFVRPEPASVSATTRFVDALEDLAAHPAPAPRREPRWTSVLNPVLRPFADAAVTRIQQLKIARRQRKDAELAEHRRQRKRAAKAAKKAQKAAAAKT